MEVNDTITIGFTLTDELGNTYSATSTEHLMEGFETALDVMCREFDTFLRQCGYYRSGTTVLTDSLTDEEFDMLHEYLTEYRNTEKAEEDNENNDEPR